MYHVDTEDDTQTTADSVEMSDAENSSMSIIAQH